MRLSSRALAPVASLFLLLSGTMAAPQPDAETRISDQAYGRISIYPALFLIDRKGLISHHWIGYVPSSELGRAIQAVLDEP